MHDGKASRNVLVALLLCYALARLFQIFPTQVPALLIVVLHVAPPAAFALLHGQRLYGTRGIFVFTFLCLVVGSVFELLSLRTGFPFGDDSFTTVMGPQIAGMPVLLAFAYLGTGYASWIVASLLLGASPKSYSAVLLQPLLAASAMTAWDLAMDPVWAYVDRAWIWHRGGAWFGVPLTNFFGWMITAWVFYQAFALWLSRRPVVPFSASWSRLAVCLYVLTAFGNLLLLAPSALPPTVSRTITDPAGRHWFTTDAVHACVLVSLLVMLPLALVAWIRTVRTTETSAHKANAGVRDQVTA